MQSINKMCALCSLITWPASIASSERVLRRTPFSIYHTRNTAVKTVPTKGEKDGPQTTNVREHWFFCNNASCSEVKTHLIDCLPAFCLTVLINLPFIPNLERRPYLLMRTKRTRRRMQAKPAKPTAMVTWKTGNEPRKVKYERTKKFFTITFHVFYQSEHSLLEFKTLNVQDSASWLACCL